MITICILIFIAGGIGSVCRYIVSSRMGALLNTTFPVGTITVNLIGSFIMGISFEVFVYFFMSLEIKIMLTVGFLGGFTTFSTYALESINLLRDGEYRALVLNILIQNIAGLLCVLAGLGFVRLLVS